MRGWRGGLYHLPSFQGRLTIESYWVVSALTAGGKSTVAKALLRLLNRYGVPAVGFKPFAVMRLMEVYNFFVNGMEPGRLYGYGAVELQTSSPLTKDLPPELVVPVHIVILDWLEEIVLVRSGSSMLDNARIYTTRGSSRFLERKDLSEMVKRKGLKISGALGRFSVGHANRRFRREIEASFKRLAGLGPRAVVCEGSGGYLPVWEGQAPPKHVFIVGSGRLHLASGIPLPEYRLSEEGKTPRLLDHLPLPEETTRQLLSVDYPLAVPEEVDRVAEGAVEELLRSAGLI